MVIRIRDVVPSADTGDQGAAVCARLTDALLQGEQVIVSFEGIKTATSSFVNAAFVPLLRIQSLSELKRRLSVVKSTRQINDMIRWRLDSGATHPATAA